MVSGVDPDRLLTRLDDFSRAFAAPLFAEFPELLPHARVENGVLEMDFHPGEYREDVRAFLSALDIFVMPSLSEGFPNSMLEAMAMSRPIVATSVDGMGEMLTDGENALVVPAADGAALGEALLRLCGDEELRGALSAASLEFAENLSIERTVERLTEIYYRVARSKQAARAGEAVRASR